MELLARLKVAAADPSENPNGLWLLCPMADPRDPARLDDQIVGAQGENEQLAIPSGIAVLDPVRNPS
jgi:hypothetical protein